MGCQATVATTSAECAQVDTDNLSKSSIYALKTNSQCQCSNIYPECESILDSRSNEYVRVY